MIVVSTGCPCGIGPEVSVLAAQRARALVPVLVGDIGVLREAAELVGVPTSRLAVLDGNAEPEGRGRIWVLQAGPELPRSARRPGRPSALAGRAQLEYVEAAYAASKRWRRAALVSGPVSKAAIARSGLRRARRFLGHTEWLQALDHADHVVMCFHSERFSTSLVTTHVPLARVPRKVSASGVANACIELVRMLRGSGVLRPRVAVASLNPHAGESELLGGEEARTIVPGIACARETIGRRGTLTGPVGAETAYRLARAGRYHGVVAMYHDQATIPMKLVAFGDAVNVTMGLSIVRTSVDHGTGYDIAWRGEADPRGMLSAMRLAERLRGASKAMGAAPVTRGT
jgi:4-hydroxythreonine-4-phosphate dehydrogenase